MAQHDRLKIDAGIQVYFCDPQSPWQRGTNENINGLLRQYFPKGSIRPVKLSITHISSRSDFGAEFDIGESGESAPNDNISG